MNQKKITVLQIVPSLISGGVEQGTLELDSAITQAGWRSLVASAGGPLQKQLSGSIFKLPLNTKNPLLILVNSYRLYQIIKKNKVDIIHARSRAPAWSAYLAAKATKKIFITTFHGTYNIQNKAKRFYNSIMVKGKVVIAVSEFIKAHILENYKINQNKIKVIPRGVDLNRFNLKIKPEKINLPRKGKIILLPGRITRWKGQHIFIDAMRGLDAFGLIVGAVENKNYAEKIKKNLPNNVFILPKTYNLPAVMISADVVVSASIEPEAFGRIALEAQALGKPVVATNLGGSLETVIDGQTGILIPPEDPQAMKEAIITALKKQDLWHNNCYQNALNRSTQIMCKQILAAYKEVLSN